MGNFAGALGVAVLAVIGRIHALGGCAGLDDALTWWRFLGGNLLPVTLGNLLGGTVLVGGTDWFIYLRARPATAEEHDPRAARPPH